MDVGQSTMLRHIRNVMSVLSALAPLALIPMWFRSYHSADEFCGGLFGERTFLIASKEGRVTAVLLGPTRFMDPKRWTASTHSVVDGTSFPTRSMRDYESALGFGWITNPDYVLSFNSSTGGTLSWGHRGPAREWTTLSIKDSAGKVRFGRTAWYNPSWDGNFGAVVKPGISGSTFSAQAAVVPRLPGAGPIVPYWFLLLLVGAVFAVTRLRRPWQFSLRSLLAAMTYVAVLLALIATLDR